MASRDDSEALLPHSMMRRSRSRGIRSCSRVIVFCLVAVGVILLPLGMMYVFEGIESGEGGLSSPGHHEDLVPVEKPDDIITSTTSSTSTSVSSAVVAAPTVPVRDDLPIRQLTKFVDPLIGTEGQGHCIPSNGI
jgi:hypothetical protein